VKKKIPYAILSVTTMVLGMASRKYGHSIPDFIATYAGDTLWALLVYWLFRLLWPNAPLQRALIGALSFSYFIEISQLYQADWINAIRNSTLGALVLGHGFLWSDFVCYTAGIVFGFILDKSMIAKNTTEISQL